jgi:hypothetical protein
MTSASRSKGEDVAAVAKRDLASLTKLERQWLKGRMCGFCEANMLGSSCYAHSGEWTLSPLEGVRDKEEVIDLGPPCDMDERRAQALTFYRPRQAAHLTDQEGQNP